VNPLTPEWQGENVFDLGGGVYYGHGMGVTRADRILRALDGARKEGATRPAYLMDTVKRQDYKRRARLAEQAGRT
jgi:protein-glutamine gamma-glutamyltransferase